MSSVLNFASTPDYLDMLASQLDSKGVVCIEDAVRPESLARWQRQLDRLVDEQGLRYFSLIQPWKETGSAFAEIATDPSFRTLLVGLTERGHQVNAMTSDIYNVLRVVAGPNGRQKSFMFHYDASVITVLVPLRIPEGAADEAGDLIAYPNRRPIRRSSVVNALEKLWYQNPVARHYMSARINNRKDDRQIYRLKAGNVYLFWGYRTLHANLACRPHSLRATLLFHHGDPHDGSLVTRAIRWSRRIRESRNLRKEAV